MLYIHTYTQIQSLKPGSQKGSQKQSENGDDNCDYADEKNDKVNAVMKFLQIKFKVGCYYYVVDNKGYYVLNDGKEIKIFRK